MMIIMQNKYLFNNRPRNCGHFILNALMYSDSRKKCCLMLELRFKLFVSFAFKHITTILLYP